MSHFNFAKLTAFSVALLVIMFLIEIVGLSVQSSSPRSPSIEYPITGELVYLPEVREEGDVPRAILLDTLTGSQAVLLSRSDISDFMSHPLFNSTGEMIAYRVGTNLTAIQTIQDKNIYFNPNADFILSDPSGWMNNDENLLLLSDVSGFSTPHQYELQNVNINTGQFSTILQMTETHEFTAIFPGLSTDMSNVKLVSLREARGNPVYTNWVALQTDAVLPDGTYTSIAFLHNFLTGETLNINEVIDDIAISIAHWSADGQFLAVEGDRNQSILRFELPTTTSLTLYGQASSARFTAGQQIQGFLGIRDLLLLSKLTDTELIFEIGQIQSGNLFSTEFLSFERSETLWGIPHTWHLSASANERQILSCLFDQTLPSQLAIGERAQVLPSGELKSIYAEPDMNATILTSISPAAQFNIIATAECSGGFRWWQIQLDDQTLGFVTEAGETEYFIEPYSIVPTAVPTTALPTTMVPTNTPAPAADSADQTLLETA